MPNGTLPLIGRTPLSVIGSPSQRGVLRLGSPRKRGSPSLRMTSVGMHSVHTHEGDTGQLALKVGGVWLAVLRVSSTA